MKKTFYFKVPNKVPERQLDSIRHEIRKYLARERRKAFPENCNYWAFDCKIGENQETARIIKVEDIPAKINELVAEKKDSFYLEILARAENKPKFSGKDKSDAKKQN